MRVALIGFEEFADLDLFLPWDLCTRVERPEWEVCILGPGPNLRSAGGLLLPTHGGLEAANKADAVIFAGGGGALREAACPSLRRRLRLEPERQILAGIGSGSCVLGALGYLDSRRVALPKEGASKLEQAGAEVLPEVLVIDENLVTAASSLASGALTCWVLEQLLGSICVRKVLCDVGPLPRRARFRSLFPQSAPWYHSNTSEKTSWALRPEVLKE